jgi:hypothetical protein
MSNDQGSMRILHRGMLSAVDQRGEMQPRRVVSIRGGSQISTRSPNAISRLRRSHVRIILPRWALVLARQRKKRNHDRDRDKVGRLTAALEGPGRWILLLGLAITDIFGV